MSTQSRPQQTSQRDDSVEGHFVREAAMDRQRLGELRSELSLLSGRFIPVAELDLAVLRFVSLAAATGASARMAAARASGGATALNAVFLAVDEELSAGFDHVLDAARAAIGSSGIHDTLRRALQELAEDARRRRALNL